VFEEFRKYIEENSLLSKSDKVLLAVSGGIDSIVMAHLFLSGNYKVGIAHCNFNLRGRESDKDEIFVRNFALNNDVPFFSERFDTTGFATEKGISIQMAARDLRYRWFEEIRAKHNYNFISVAHNLNDNAETFLINLTRGTGIAGLAGMKPKHRLIIRPLLFASRAAIVDYSNLNNIDYREDESNSETKYTRNKIRHIILPQFREINPSFETTIIETAERLNEINEIVTGYIAEIREKVIIQRSGSIIFRISMLQGLSPKRTMLFELFRPYGVSRGQLDDVINLIDAKTGTRLMTAGYRLLKNRKELIVSRITDDSEMNIEIKTVKDFLKYTGCISAEITRIKAGMTIPESSYIACLDADRITFPMLIRKWRHGDSFYPFGMKQKKKLSDYFIDRKYSIHAKENCRILESDGKIVWIMNDRIDNRFRITAGTKNALLIEVKSPTDERSFPDSVNASVNH
jgi:tRNA(Ile)-lysidine synthase